MANAPYSNPPSASSKTDADGIYFGWMGLAQDATFRSNMELIYSGAIKAALTDATVIAALTLSMKNALTDVTVIAADTLGMKNALTDVTVIAAHTLAIKNALCDAGVDACLADVIADGIFVGISALIAADVTLSKEDVTRLLTMIAIAATSERRSLFVRDTSAPAYDELKANVIKTKDGVLSP